MASSFWRAKSKAQSTAEQSVTAGEYVPGSDGAAPTAAPDARTLLALMRKTRGRMQGDVSVHFDLHTPSSREQMYCYIDAASGALRRHSSSSSRRQSDRSSKKDKIETLIDDLRSCTVSVSYNCNLRRQVLRITPIEAQQQISLYPDDASQLVHWFAAVLCWQPLKQDQSIPNSSTHRCPLPAKPSSLDFGSDGPLRQLRSGDGFTIIKEDSAILMDNESFHDWDKNHAFAAGSVQVQCTVRVNGEFTVRTLDKSSGTITINLSQLPRSAVQRVDQSVFGQAFILAIYPQYSHDITSCSRLRTVYLSLSSRNLFETWFVLLRSCALPELYISQDGTYPSQTIASSGPEEHISSTETTFLRIEQRLRVQVIQIRLFRKARGSTQSPKGEGCVEMRLDEHIREKIPVRFDGSSNLNVLKQGQFHELPARLRSLTIKVSKDSQMFDDSRERSQSKSDDNPNHSPSSICCEGRVDARFLDAAVESQTVISLYDQDESEVGEITLSLHRDKQHVLMEREYYPLFESLRGNSFQSTVEICRHLATVKPEIIGILLNIFQASGKAQIWLQSIAQAEIDAIYPSPHSSKIESKGNGDSRQHNANKILFEENSLFVKAAELFLKRIGTEFLKGVLVNKLMSIKDGDPDCEVDPAMLKASDDILSNWRHLTGLTDAVWTEIYHSRFQLPEELCSLCRYVHVVLKIRHATKKIEYDSIIRLLILHFFCVAITGFQERGILKENSERNVTLVVKSFLRLVQGAEQSNVDSWMAPIDDYWSSQRAKLRQYVDDICTSPDKRKMLAMSLADATAPTSETQSYRIPAKHMYPNENRQSLESATSKAEESMTASYTVGPLAALTCRLATVAREGYLSLPWLIDPARELARLVATWSEYPAATLISSAQDTGSSSMSPDLETFNRCCLRAREATASRVASLATAIDHDYGEMGVIQQQWIILAEKFEADSSLYWQSHLGAQRSMRDRHNTITSTQTGAQEIRATAVTARKKDSLGSNPGPSRGSSIRSEVKNTQSPSRATQDNAMRKLGWM